MTRLETLFLRPSLAFKAESLFAWAGNFLNLDSYLRGLCQSCSTMALCPIKAADLVSGLCSLRALKSDVEGPKIAWMYF